MPSPLRGNAFRSGKAKLLGEGQGRTGHRRARAVEPEVFAAEGQRSHLYGPGGEGGSKGKAQAPSEALHEQGGGHSAESRSEHHEGHG